ncbi:hypothetical protein H2200_008764 [Cladophialophora chaetospira]|uniref:alpha-L-rhamnosidase n=1 Tax=Cladophialophora chaetospira TaxID=386627 RepID=A0AA38X532_9EURO|nr:hypothetical protein H2200_008764 [Cladophialophora chaetospira]
MSAAPSSVRVSAPTFEHHHNGFGIHSARPRISWKFSRSDSQVCDWFQCAYDLEVGGIATEGAQSCHVESSESSLVPWPEGCEDLSSRERRQVRVRCYGRFKDAEGTCRKDITPWSKWSVVEAALLNQNDWIARMISIPHPPPLNDDGSLRPLRFRKSFHLPKDAVISTARLYATSHGVYHATLNGEDVGDQCMTPGWQSYLKRLHYQVYDVANLLKPESQNILEIDVGPGWFASALTSTNQRFFYGDSLGVLAQLEVTLRVDAAGDAVQWVETIRTDETWSCTTSPILSSEIYNGEVFDQRREAELREATQAGRAWDETRISDVHVGKLVSPDAPPVRVTVTLKPQSVSRSASGQTILDFGQNVVGRVRIVGSMDAKKSWKPKGHRIVFRHAEVMQANEIYTRPLREAKATDVLICDGQPFKSWAPRFTFHGFRYVEVEGWSPDDSDWPLMADSIVAEVIHTDLQRTGTFACSNEEVNRLHENAVWSMRGNFLSVPTDCPQRDDREGWTGDINIFMSAANFLYNTAGMLGHWLEDLYADQMEESDQWRKGVVPLVVPNCFLTKTTPHPNPDQGWDPLPSGIWSDAAIMVPWELFRSTGDVDILLRQYDSMQQYLVAGVARGDDYLWDPEIWQFGDWLDPTAPVNNSGQTRTDGTFIADCFLIHSTRLVKFVATVLGKEADAGRYSNALHLLQKSFHRKFVTAAGLVLPDTPTALALVIALQLVSQAATTAVANRLRRSLRLLDFRIPTGFAGTAYLLSALTQSSQPSLAYTMLLSSAQPSLLYPVRMGATTIWERWDALKPDGTVNEGNMTSFNHYALGAVVSWLHECVGGIKILSPSDSQIYAEMELLQQEQSDNEEHGSGTCSSDQLLTFLIKPEIHHALRFAKATYDSRCGLAECRWSFTGDMATPEGTTVGQRVLVEILVPPNSTAWIVLPRLESWRMGSSEWREYTQPKAKAPASTAIKVGSGQYTFRVNYEKENNGVDSTFPTEPLLPPWGRALY